jgi:hypothetical protein
VEEISEPIQTIPESKEVMRETTRDRNLDTSEGIEDENTSISSRIKSVINHKFEEDKIENVDNTDEAEVM